MSFTPFTPFTPVTATSTPSTIETADVALIENTSDLVPIAVRVDGQPLTLAAGWPSAGFVGHLIPPDSALPVQVLPPPAARPTLSVAALGADGSTADLRVTPAVAGNPPARWAFVTLTANVVTSVPLDGVIGAATGRAVTITAPTEGTIAVRGDGGTPDTTTGASAVLDGVHDSAAIVVTNLVGGVPTLRAVSPTGGVLAITTT